MIWTRPNTGDVKRVIKFAWLPMLNKYTHKVYWLQRVRCEYFYQNRYDMSWLNWELDIVEPV